MAEVAKFKKSDLEKRTVKIGISYKHFRWMLAFLLFIVLQVEGHTSSAWISATSAGGAGTDWGNSIRSNKYGDFCITGFFSSSLTFSNKTIISAGATDTFIAKFLDSGKLDWLLPIGGAEDDIGKDIAFDRDRNIYVTGWFNNSTTFYSTRGAAKTVIGNGETVFLAKYSKNGILEWVRTGISSAPFPVINRGHGIAIEPGTGAIYLTGMSQMDTVFSSTDNLDHIVPGPGTWHMFLVRYDIDGNFLWGQRNEASPNSISHRVAVDKNNNAYVTGWFEGAVTFYGNDGLNQTVTGLSGPVQEYPDYPDDAFIVKYDEEGNVKWVNQIGGYKAIGTDIAASDDGKISVTGFIGNIEGTPGQAQTIATSQAGGSDINLGGGRLTNPYNADAFITTYDKDGILLNADRIGGIQNDGGGGLSYDDKNLYATGVFQGSIDAGGSVLTGQKENNLFLLKYSKHGIVSAEKADGAGNIQLEQNSRICVLPGNRISVTGAYSDEAIFGNVTLHSAGAEDMFLAGTKNMPPVMDNPPSLQITARPSTLWPPNHKFVTVKVDVKASHDSGRMPAIKLLSVTCNGTCDEKINIAGASLNTDDREFMLRSEKNKGGRERIYKIVYSATDTAGHVTKAETSVRVSKEIAQPPSINSCDDGIEACNGNAPCISCLQDAECASGPNPVWTGTACACTDDNPANCVYEFCCALGFDWDPESCACLPES